MSKQHRLFSNSKDYHITIKGIDDSAIFYDNEDRIVFLEKLDVCKKKFELPKMNISMFEVENVVTTVSGDPTEEQKSAQQKAQFIADSIEGVRTVLTFN